MLQTQSVFAANICEMHNQKIMPTKFMENMKKTANRQNK